MAKVRVKGVRVKYIPSFERVLQNCSINLRNEYQSSDIPLLASPQGGVAARVKKCRAASADSADGVVFRLRTIRKTTPSASASVASHHFFDDAATPPCGDARRGISLTCNSFPYL